jgi:hypothetical protein
LPPPVKSLPPAAVGVPSKRSPNSGRSARNRKIGPVRSLTIFAVPTIRGTITSVSPARRSVTAVTNSSASPQKKRANRGSVPPA